MCATPRFARFKLKVKKNAIFFIIGDKAKFTELHTLSHSREFFLGKSTLGFHTYPLGLAVCLLLGSSELLASFRLFLECLTFGLLLCFLLLLLSCSISLSEDDSEEEEELEEESESSE